MNSSLQMQRRLEWILVAVFILTLPLLNPWVRGDGVGYYAYARAPLIEHSLDFSRDYQSANEGFREARCDPNGRPKAEFRTSTGHLDNHFTVGPAILWSPFLLTAHIGVLSARALGSPTAADGFSAPYRYAMALGTGIYGFLGIYLSFRLARKYIRLIWAFLGALAIWWATSLPVYMYFNPSWSHAHSAFMVALFLFYWDATLEDRSLAQWLVLGLIVGLMIEVYYVNAMLLVILVVEAAVAYSKILRPPGQVEAGFTGLFMRQTVFVAVVCLVMIPTFVTRSIVYGGPLKTGYIPIRSWLWDSPVFLRVLFSSNHGAFSWTPVLVLSAVGLFLFAVKLPRIGVPFFAGAVAFYLCISIYPDWAGIASFGNRFFISLTALFVLGLASLLERLAERFAQPRAVLLASSTLLAGLTLWNLGLIYQWGTHLIPVRGPISFREATHNQFFVVPAELTSQLRSYLFRRGDMMQQIERRDIEQQKRTQP